MEPCNPTNIEASRYFTEIGRVLLGIDSSSLERIVKRLDEARWSGQAVYTCGNGGSAATAIHFASDLAKGARAKGKPPFKALSLCENISLVTAWANDECYDCVFAERLSPWVRKEDVLFAISSSGNSENVIRALEVAKTAGATTIGLAGFDGGRLARECDLCLVVPSHCTEQVEDVHLLLCHYITTALRSLPAKSPAADQPLVLPVISQ